MNYGELPRGYKRILRIDLENDKLGTVFVSALSCFIMLLMLLVGVFICGLDYMRDYIFVDTSLEFGKVVFRFILSVFGLIFYELVMVLMRALLVKILCKDSKIKSRSKSMYFYVASSGYFSKKSYFAISFIPFIISEILLFVFCFIVPPEYFIPVYLILVLNSSSIAGDLYVLYFISRFDKNLLIKDTGKSVCFYSNV